LITIARDANSEVSLPLFRAKYFDKVFSKRSFDKSEREVHESCDKQYARGVQLMREAKLDDPTDVRESWGVVMGMLARRGA
jgi:hypothetical protein